MDADTDDLVMQLQEQVIKYKTERYEAIEREKKAKQELANVQQQLSQTREEQAETRQKFRQLAEENVFLQESRQEESQQVKQHVDTANADLDRVIQKLATKEMEIAQLRTTVEKRDQIVLALRKQLQEQDLGARKLRESAVAMRDRLQDQDKQKQTVNEQLQKAEQVYQALKQQISERDRIIGERDTQLKQMDNMKDLVERLTCECAEKDERISRAAKDLEAAQAGTKDEQAAHDKTKELCREIEEQLAFARHEFEQLKAKSSTEIDALRSEAGSKQSDLDGQLESSREELARYKEMYTKSDELRVSLEAELSSQKENNRALESTLKETTTELEEKLKAVTEQAKAANVTHAEAKKEWETTQKIEQRKRNHLVKELKSQLKRETLRAKTLEANLEAAEDENRTKFRLDRQSSTSSSTAPVPVSNGSRRHSRAGSLSSSESSSPRLPPTPSSLAHSHMPPHALSDRSRSDSISSVSSQLSTASSQSCGSNPPPTLNPFSHSHSYAPSSQTILTPKNLQQHHVSPMSAPHVERNENFQTLNTSSSAPLGARSSLGNASSARKRPSAAAAASAHSNGVSTSPRVMVSPAEEVTAALSKRLADARNDNYKLRQKISYLEDTVQQMTLDLARKRQVMQNFVRRVETGVFATGEPTSIRADTKVGRERLRKEIFQKMELMLEDTTLQNEALRESRDQIAGEVHRLFAENRTLKTKLKDLHASVDAKEQHMATQKAKLAAALDRSAGIGVGVGVGGEHTSPSIAHHHVGVASHKGGADRLPARVVHAQLNPEKTELAVPRSPRLGLRKESSDSATQTELP